MFTFFNHSMAAILDFQNGGYYGVNYGNILACKLPRLLILVSNYTFEGARNTLEKVPMHPNQPNTLIIKKNHRYIRKNTAEMHMELHYFVEKGHKVSLSGHGGRYRGPPE